MKKYFLVLILIFSFVSAIYGNNRYQYLGDTPNGDKVYLDVLSISRTDYHGLIKSSVVRFWGKVELSNDGRKNLMQNSNNQKWNAMIKNVSEIKQCFEIDFDKNMYRVVQAMYYSAKGNLLYTAGPYSNYEGWSYIAPDTMAEVMRYAVKYFLDGGNSSIQIPQQPSISSNPINPVLPLNIPEQHAVTRNSDKKYIFQLAMSATPQELEEASQAGIDFNIRSEGDLDGDFLFDYGESPLHTAAAYNHNAGSIKFLISQGIDVNATAYSGNTVIGTPLSCAVRNRNIEAIRELLNAGADPNCYSSSGNYDGGTTLHIVASEYRNYFDAKIVIDALIKAGAEINYHNSLSNSEMINFKKGNSFPKYRSAWTPSQPWGNLFENFSHVALNDFLSSCTPLMYAVIHDNADVVNILLDFDADPNIHNLEDKTAFDYAKMLPPTTKIRSSKTFRRLQSVSK